MDLQAPIVTFVTYAVFAWHLSSSDIHWCGMDPMSALSRKEIAGG